jgi:hypothetical protein
MWKSSTWRSTVIGLHGLLQRQLYFFRVVLIVCNVSFIVCVALCAVLSVVRYSVCCVLL